MNTIYLYVGILTYLFMGATMYLLGVGANKLEPKLPFLWKHYKSLNIYIVLSILFFALMSGLRYRVGADCESYANLYEKWKTGVLWSENRADTIEPMFAFFCRIFAAIDAGRVVFLGWLAFMEIVFFYSAMRSRSYLFPFLGLVLILGPHFLSWNNGIRQVISSCIFVYALVGVINGKKKLWHYFFWIILAYSMHKSAIMLLPLFVVKFYERKPNKWLSLALLFFAVFISRSGVSLIDFSWAESLLESLNYDDYSYRFESFLDQDATIQNYGPRRILLLASYIFIILFSEKLYDKYKSDRLFCVAYLFFMIYACGTEALLSKSLLFSRPLLYFTPFYLIVTAYLLYYLKITKQPLWLWVGITLTCTYSIVNAIAEFPFPEEVANYKFIFFHP